MINRRELLRGAGVVTGAAILSKLHGSALSAPAARIEVLLNERLGTISPNIYGHFVEHLGGVVYDGIWVGGSSKIANVNGIRKDLVDHLRRIKAPVVRWPGGCFADQYNWKDGIGVSDKRPVRTNFWAESGEWAKDMSAEPIQRFDPNTFGTHEFMQFCRLAGAQPYLAANLRSLPAEDFYRWVEYCNSPANSTTLAKMRAANGDTEPFGVRYWGVGNEAWGCGGNFTAPEYAAAFRHFSSWAPGYGVPLSLIVSGASDDDYEWTRGFMRGLLEKGPGQINSVYGMSIHHYSWNLSRGKTSDWTAGKGDAVGFEPVDWYELMMQGDQMEKIIRGHWQALAEFDPQHHIKLVVDEWGAWYKPGSQVDPSHLLGQQITMRDAVMSALTLDTFNRHPDKVSMANCAQLINCLNSLFLAHEDRFITTPVFHVFEMYTAHQGGEGLRTVFHAPTANYQRDGKPASLWSLNGSASLREKTLTLTVANVDVEHPFETEIAIKGATIQSATVTSLHHADIHAHNTFAEPNAVKQTTRQVKTQGDTLRYEFPSASVTSMQITLG
jgi:alpha-N-arabinofuranosidase